MKISKEWFERRAALEGDLEIGAGSLMEYDKDVLSADLALVRPLVGLYVGLLSGDELRAFERLCTAGKAARSYSGTAGVFGLAKVAMIDD